jgi:hypothetical protein
MTEQTSEPRTAAVCKHLLIYRDTHGTGWACSHCKRRFYPAWHEAAAPASPDVVDEEAVLDNAVPSIARFGRVPRTEVIRSIVTAIHEQGMRVAAAYAEGEPE